MKQVPYPSEHRNYAPKLRAAAVAEAVAVFVARMIDQARKN